MASSSIYRGDSDSFTLSVPLTIWSASGHFFFAIKAKGLVNAFDATDTNAIIKKTYDDTYITSTTSTMKVYTLTLLHTDTVEATPGKYVGEFQWVSADATPVVKTFAPFKYTINGDVNQRIS